MGQREREKRMRASLRASEERTQRASFDAVCAPGLEGVVAKRRGSLYRPGDRGWVKIKNREYWRYELERESAVSQQRRRVFV